MLYHFMPEAACGNHAPERQKPGSFTLPGFRNLAKTCQWGVGASRYSAFARIASVSLALDSPNSSADIAMVCLIGFHSAFFTSATKAMGM